jgi:hypothetical protein
MDSVSVREYFTDAIRFWEPRRVIYNAVLAVIVIAYFVAGYPASKAATSIDFALALFILAVVANVAYCAAYLADVFVQASGFRQVWQRSRWILFALGTTFAAVIVCGHGDVQSRQSVAIPPAIDGTNSTSSPSLKAYLAPPRKRMSSSFT